MAVAVRNVLCKASLHWRRQWEVKRSLLHFTLLPLKLGLTEYTEWPEKKPDELLTATSTVQKSVKLILQQQNGRK